MVQQSDLPVPSNPGWYGKDKRDSTEWRHQLSETHLAELDGAIKALTQPGVDLSTVTRKDVVGYLPTLSPLLDEISHDLLHGFGFCLLKGLPVERYSVREAAAAYWAIGCHFGNPTPQNGKGHLLGHVKDLGHDLSNPATRIYATNAAQPFHVDLCDVVGLLCLKTARRGGESIIASSVTLYNELMKINPEYVRVLSQPIHHDRKGEIPAGKEPYYQIPVFNFVGSELSVFLSPDFVRTVERFPEVPRHTPELKEALRLMQELPLREDIRLDMVLEPGDMQFIHNHTIVHSRTSYEDHEDPEKKRHLLRLWLSPPEARTLPLCFAEQYSNVTPGERGGIRVAGVTPVLRYEAE